MNDNLPPLYIRYFKQCPYRFREVMEIENAIFQDLESFGKEIIFKIAMEKFRIFVWKNF